MLKAIKFPLYVVTHPIDGFYRMKHEKEGAIWVAILNVFLFWVFYSINKQYAGFVVNRVNPLSLNTLLDLGAVVAMFLLWCVGNWSITTLMEGEGKFSDIFMATSYSLTPMVIAYLPATLVGNYVADNEETFYFLIISIATFWFFGLLFFGIMSIHNYSLLKTVITLFMTVIAILVIIFLLLLMVTLMQQVYMFGHSIYTELLFRS